ncbi:pseudaminic acid synthase [Subsaximicrobium wynnwilliamsii]|uniref:Pseudaminic acid synthase n=1 Tax=Subsaximicrobium wynnwilliamsii TaxID=291179 RepID=A0A5C6ZIW7_9FLAO|nr:pseudaminic acid synthase [Subsaximicrobium wynnwilliamsii]TXD83956.1 pseudaminic acid synthase [Subsaximicrobium wynnwilliamsii]TXD89696.1 pseudaminic acid synthase [Subsaximicrobium wynnwilliamsii]TXE01681.1 pseudaminic acid synthase [Subsaximicrobium wynnwilliamsii]
MKIGTKSIGENHPCFIIAELSANHNGDLNVAIETIRAAKKAGADAIKLQTYTPDTLTIDCDNAHFKIDGGTLWDGKTLYELYGEAYTPWEWHQRLFEVAKEEGLICFSSPFDATAVDFLETLNVPAYKIASFEIQDIPLIEYAASKGKPIIISTGIAQEEDIKLAVETCRNAGNKEIILLKCTSSYPAPLELANLNTIPDLKERFGVTAGFSDHTYGSLAPTVATALGAKVIEKHFILDKSVGGPDADFSLDVEEFTEMVNKVRDTERLLGQVSYEVSEKVEKNRKFARSLFVVKDAKAGESITKENVRSIRPGYGMHPKHFEAVIGKVFCIDVEKGAPLSHKMIEKS